MDSRNAMLLIAGVLAAFCISTTSAQGDPFSSATVSGAGELLKFGGGGGSGYYSYNPKWLSSYARYNFPPKSWFPFHYHRGATELFFVTRGVVKVIIFEKRNNGWRPTEYVLGPNKFVIIRAGDYHAYYGDKFRPSTAFSIYSGPYVKTRYWLTYKKNSGFYKASPSNKEVTDLVKAKTVETASSNQLDFQQIIGDAGGNAGGDEEGDGNK